MPEPHSSDAPARSAILIYACCIYPACIAAITLPITWCAAAVLDIGLHETLEISYAVLLLWTVSMLLIGSLVENKSGRPASEPADIVRCSRYGFWLPSILACVVIPPLVVYIAAAGLPAYFASHAIYTRFHRKNGAKTQIHP